MAKVVVVVEVFVAQGQGEYPLGHQFGHAVFDPLGIAMVGETGGEASKDAGFGFHLPQQESAGVRSDGSAIEPSGDQPAAKPLEIELACVTLCSHRAASLLVALFVSAKQLMPQKAAIFYRGGEKCGLGRFGVELDIPR